MPTCASDNSLHFYPSRCPSASGSNSVSPILPSSPISSSPTQMSMMTNYKRSISDVSNSSQSSAWSQESAGSAVAPLTVKMRQRNREHQHQHELESPSPSPATQSADNQHSQKQNSPKRGILMRLILWYFNFIIRILSGIINSIMFMMRAPAVWGSVWVCIFFVILQLPLAFLKYFLSMLYTPASELARNKRCVLISGGSTVQAVHLARNFHKAGARVIVCETEGLFGLARFSTACSKFYTVPRPNLNNTTEYIKALKNIVEKEKAAYYIPVSSTSPAYYDALAKPHLEVLGCECFVPCASVVTALDDPLELLKRCQSVGLTTPVHFVLKSVDDALMLYETGALRSGRHMMLAAGLAGLRDRVKVPLPPSAQEFQNIRHDISEKNPWVVVRDPGGPHFITCTTVKNSKVVANVICRVDETKGLIPETRNDILDWLERFFSRSFSLTPINGHLSFRLVVSENNELVSIGCRVGIGLPYVCLTSVHPRLVWRPCRHFSRQSSGPLLVGEPCQSKEKAFASALKQATDKNTNFFGSVINKRDALFVYWDPLPYCAYYHLQLPFIRLAGVLRAQPHQHNPPLAVVQ
ncbi:uncharacterized protein LOC130675467 [Microplitis mediator]|uniref:uncharacterized protein LOC130675467 n=1 Tax=Microplitis mediator TaxID=375433 RepID=UPI002553B489|nr:uncharacterized protein LOC130675467 [Microplitis mediator]